MAPARRPISTTSVTARPAYACAATAPNCTTGACPGSYPSVCAETSPQCDGPDCNPENGNMTGPTRNGTDFRMSHTNVGCDTFAEAFPTQKADGTYQLSPDCNPWTNGARILCDGDLRVQPPRDHHPGGERVRQRPDAGDHPALCARLSWRATPARARATAATSRAASYRQTSTRTLLPARTTQRPSCTSSSSRSSAPRRSAACPLERFDGRC